MGCVCLGPRTNARRQRGLTTEARARARAHLLAGVALLDEEKDARKEVHGSAHTHTHLHLQKEGWDFGGGGKVAEEGTPSYPTIHRHTRKGGPVGLHICQGDRHPAKK